jgi:hypothetical protein
MEEVRAALPSTPAPQEETRDPVVQANLGRARRSDVEPNIELAESIERMAAREIRRRNLDVPDPASIDFADPDRRNPSGEYAEE